MEPTHKEGVTGLRSKSCVFTLTGKKEEDWTQLHVRPFFSGDTDSLPTAYFIENTHADTHTFHLRVIAISRFKARENSPWLVLKMEKDT